MRKYLKIKKKNFFNSSVDNSPKRNERPKGYADRVEDLIYILMKNALKNIAMKNEKIR